MINVFIVASIIYISCMEPLFVEAKIIGLPRSSAVNNFFGRVQSMTSSITDVVLSPTVPSVYFLTAEKKNKAPAKT